MAHNEYEQRLQEIESKLAFQEQTIETLNQVIVCQQHDMTKLRIQMQSVLDKLASATVSSIASQAEETPPPHY